MKLISLYFKGDGKIIRAIVDSDDIEYWKDLGACETPTELENNDFLEIGDEDPQIKEEEDEPIPTQIDCDKGFGEPGSYRFHQLSIAELDDFNSIMDYAFKISGRKIRKYKNGSLITYRKNALSLIRRTLNGG